MRASTLIIVTRRAGIATAVAAWLGACTRKRHVGIAAGSPPYDSQ